MRSNTSKFLQPSCIIPPQIVTITASTGQHTDHVWPAWGLPLPTLPAWYRLSRENVDHCKFKQRQRILLSLGSTSHENNPTFWLQTSILWRKIWETVKGSYMYSPQFKNLLYWVLRTSWRKYFAAAVLSLNWCKTIRIDTRTSTSHRVHSSQRISSYIKNYVFTVFLVVTGQTYENL
jgi:hypothetical protein